MLHFYFTPATGEWCEKHLLDLENKQPDNIKHQLTGRFWSAPLPAVTWSPGARQSKAAPHQNRQIHWEGYNHGSPHLWFKASTAPLPAASLCLFSRPVTSPQSNCIPTNMINSSITPAGCKITNPWQQPQPGEAIFHSWALGLKVKQWLLHPLAILISRRRCERLLHPPACHPRAKDARDPG